MSSSIPEETGAGSSHVFDLELSCPGVSATVLALELALHSAKLEGFQVERTGTLDESALCFLVVRFTARLLYGADLVCDGDRVIACFTSSPGPWTTEERMKTFERAFGPLLDAVSATFKSRVVVRSAEK